MMNRTLWIHQFDQFGIPPPVGPSIVKQTFNRVCVKALDGANWMNQFDTSSDTVGSVDDCANLVKLFNQEGLACDFWCNVTKADLAQAAPIYAELCKLPGRLFLDVEPYQGFWGDFSSLDSLLNIVRGLDAAKLGITFDPRQPDWIKPALNWVDVWSPQLYDPSWTANLYALETDGMERWEPLLDANGSGAQWLQILRDPRIGSTRGRTGFGIFRAPLVGQERIVTLAGLA